MFLSLKIFVEPHNILVPSLFKHHYFLHNLLCLRII
jgi:hypothetical protein